MEENEKMQEYIRDYETQYPYKWWKNESGWLTSGCHGCYGEVMWRASKNEAKSVFWDVVKSYMPGIRFYKVS